MISIHVVMVVSPRGTLFDKYQIINEFDIMLDDMKLKFPILTDENLLYMVKTGKYISEKNFTFLYHEFKC